MTERRLSNLVGFDDAPFPRSSRSRVDVVGAIFAGSRFDGVLTGSVERDGDDATDRLAQLLGQSRFFEHVQAILLQGISFGGFNVVDIHRLQREAGRPVLVVVRRPPDLNSIRRALLEKVPGGADKWKLIEKAGPPEPAAGLYIQRAGLSPAEAEQVLRRFALHGRLPEPLRVAHLVAGALTGGSSRGRA